MLPGQPLHDAVSAELRSLIDLAERHAALRRPAMESAEKLVMSYADPYETDPATGRRLNPHERSIVVPFTAAAIETLVAFWLMSFTSRQPTIPLKSNDPRLDRGAEYLETVMDSMHEDDNLDAKMWSWLWSASLYGRGYMHTCWYSEHELVQVEQTQPMLGMLGISTGMETVSQPQWQLVEERQVNTPLEPRMVLQDPRAPGWDPQQGEFIAFETWLSWNRLKRHEIEGQLFNVDKVKLQSAGGQDQRTNSNLSPGQYAPVRQDQHATAGDPGYYQAHHIWVRLIPAEWPRPEVAIGTSYVPQIWEFVIIEQTICMARPSSQRRFPIYCMDSHFDAHNLFNPGDAELVLGLAQMANFLANARLAGLRKGIYQNIVYDPAGLYNPEDINAATPGLRLRAKLASMPIEKIVTMLPMADVTRNLLVDISSMGDMIKFATGAVDSLQGIMMAGNRTAMEVEGVMRAAQGRAGQRGRLMWSQGVRPWARHELRDIQDHLTQEKYYTMVGDAARKVDGGRALVGPEHIQGDIVLRAVNVNEPIRKEQIGGLWMKMAEMTAASPIASSKLDWVKMLGEAAHLLGARNFEDFVIQGVPAQPIQVQPNAQVEQQVAAGNLVPQATGANPLAAALAQLQGGPSAGGGLQ